MSPQLAALFTQHKTAALGVAGAGVVGLALLNKRKKGAAATGTTSPAGTIPAAAVVPASGVQGAYPNTSPTDIYNGIMDQLLKEQAAMTPPVAAATPKPIASTLFAPTGSGNYVRYGDGTIGEVETDGSVYGIAPGENWNYEGPRSVVQLPANYNGPNYASKVGNLANAAKATGGTA